VNAAGVPALAKKVGALDARAKLVSAVAIGPEWRLQTLSLIFMGWGFYMIHGSLQVFASELQGLL